MNSRNLIVTAKSKVQIFLPEASIFSSSSSGTRPISARPAFCVPHHHSPAPLHRRIFSSRLFALFLFLFFSLYKTQDHQLKSSLSADLFFSHCTSDSDECVERKPARF
ncbi:hypothetical protein BDW74DRAFT_39852 [Aspergillus multicolor]|uniref:uncharacterized protein n=1 Tax=Aspergillus multicolor TaxID=41759 RepID=UPI003CCD1296